MNNDVDYNTSIIDELFNTCSLDIVQLCWSYVNRPEQGPQARHSLIVYRKFSGLDFSFLNVYKVGIGCIPIVTLPPPPPDDYKYIDIIRRVSEVYLLHGRIDELIHPQ
jgi:hypothetical protein